MQVHYAHHTVFFPRNAKNSSQNSLLLIRRDFFKTWLACGHRLRHEKVCPQNVDVFDVVLNLIWSPTAHTLPSFFERPGICCWHSSNRIKEQFIQSNFNCAKLYDNDIGWRYSDDTEHRAKVGAFAIHRPCSEKRKGCHRLCLVESILDAIFPKDSGNFVYVFLWYWILRYEQLATESAVGMGTATGRGRISILQDARGKEWYKTVSQFPGEQVIDIARRLVIRLIPDWDTILVVLEIFPKKPFQQTCAIGYDCIHCIWLSNAIEAQSLSFSYLLLMRNYFAKKLHYLQMSMLHNKTDFINYRVRDAAQVSNTDDS